MVKLADTKAQPVRPTSHEKVTDRTPLTLSVDLRSDETQLKKPSEVWHHFT